MSDDPTLGQPDTPETRIERALWYIAEFGSFDGAHHKQWVLDQAARALTGCPVAEVSLPDSPECKYTIQGESREYIGWRGVYDEDWEGIPP